LKTLYATAKTKPATFFDKALFGVDESSLEINVPRSLCFSLITRNTVDSLKELLS